MRGIAISAAAPRSAVPRFALPSCPQLKTVASATAGSAVRDGGYNKAVGGRTKISQLLDVSDGGRSHIGSTVTVCGWLRTVRAQKDVTFVKVNDGSTCREIQVVIEAGVPGAEEVSAQSAGASVRIRGIVVESPAKGQEIELCITGGSAANSSRHGVWVLGTVDAKAYPLAKKRHSLEFLRSVAHLRMRSNLLGAVSRVRSALAGATHSFFQGRGFIHVHTPIITTVDCEGTGEMFSVSTAAAGSSAPSPEPVVSPTSADQLALQASKDKVRELKAAGVAGQEVKEAIAELRQLKLLCGEGAVGDSETKAAAGMAPGGKGKEFFGQPAFLTVSGQLSAESLSCALGDVYTFGPTFRAEVSHTARHLAEFWMVEPEMAFADLCDSMDCAEDYIRYCARAVLDKCRPDLEFLAGRVDNNLLTHLEAIATQDFQRITYCEAVEELAQAVASGQAKFEFEVSWGKELQTEHEKWLTEVLFKKPTIVYNYPKDCKAFYMRLNEDGRTVAAMDLLCPGIGELAGGSQREERLDKLDYRMEEMGISKEDLWWYRDLRQFGSVPHAGFGVGFERMVMLCTGVHNIRDVIPFPRYPGHAFF